MAKQRKRRHAPRKALIHTQQQEMTPEHLFESGNYQDAIDLLKPHIAQHPTDDQKRRLLGQILFELDQYKEAIETWLALQEKTCNDLISIGTAYLNVKEWDQAIPWIEASLQQNQSAHTYYLLACAYFKEYSESNSWVLLEEPDRFQQAITFLQQARTLPGCPASAYLLLHDKLRSLAHDAFAEQEQEGDSADQESHRVIAEAFEHYPSDDWVRLEFGEDLVSQGNFAEALIVVTPLIEADPTSPEDVYLRAIASAIYASTELKLYEKALRYIDLLPSSSRWAQFYHNDLPKLKGHLLTLQGHYDQALEQYQQEIQKDSDRDVFLGHWCSAWVWLQRGEFEACLTSLREAMDIWFFHASPSAHQTILDDEPVTIAAAHVSVSPTWCIQPLCQSLLEEREELDTELKGQLSYLLYKTGFHQDDYGDEGKYAPEVQLLEHAEDWYPHPLLSKDLVDIFLLRDDISSAIEHHLRYYSYLYNTHPEDFDEEEINHFAVPEDMPDEKQRALHSAAFQQLQNCQDADTIRAVFLVFFDNFWCSLLHEGNMYQELVDVTKLLMDTLEDVNHLLFDHALALSELGRNEESEAVYRHYLEHHPDNADTLHNLSLLAEQKGDFQEALALSDKAVTLAPDDEIIVRVNTRMKRDLEARERARQEQIHQEQLRQEREQFWSQLSNNQKWLLCLMTLYSPAHWPDLVPHVKHDEDLLRQLPADWEDLVKREACSQDDETLAFTVVPLLQPCIQSEGFRLWLASEIARVQVRKKKNLWFPQAQDLEDTVLSQLSPAQRTLLQQALMRKIEQVSRSGLQHLHLSFYRRVWKRLLLQWEMHSELVDLCEVFLARLSGMERQELWECAYCAHLSPSNYHARAEMWYKRYLEGGENRAAYHNLSVMYLDNKQYQDALHMIDQALKLDPEDEGSRSQKERIDRALHEDSEKRRQQDLEQRRQAEQRERYLKELEQQIQAHLGEVDVYKQKILHAIKETRYSFSKRSLAQQLRMEDWSFAGHWKKLVAWGMILEEGRQAAGLHPLIEMYLEQGWPVPVTSSLRTVVINPAAGSFVKPIFGSKQEFKLYTVMLEMFHGQLVFPNMALQAIFPYQKMKELLTKEEFNYYMISHVDICITRTTSYFPLIAFEVDGPYHEQEERQKKDALKNAIFEKGGLGLIRLQIGYQPLSTRDIWDGVREKINQALYLWRSDATRKGWIEDLETELGMSRFGEETSEPGDE